MHRNSTVAGRPFEAFDDKGSEQDRLRPRSGSQDLGIGGRTNKPTPRSAPIAIQHCARRSSSSSSSSTTPAPHRHHSSSASIASRPRAYVTSIRKCGHTPRRSRTNPVGWQFRNQGRVSPGRHGRAFYKSPIEMKSSKQYGLIGVPERSARCRPFPYRAAGKSAVHSFVDSFSFSVPVAVFAAKRPILFGRPVLPSMVHH
ncbi:hypothetical protein ZHAS_00011872 [Anopheles sinensis]|uniref:Uncharacterized protein n=1 Tax=Anopheles sinensis TaxID=74873 RepID=A0A084W1E8_ANOSI|nr:hypothetical protein ZHAS_00011872 [Anopheles sinensis]